MTQKELAEACGIGESALRSYELGARFPKETSLNRIANALTVRSEIFGGYGISTEMQLIHALFNFEDRFDIGPEPDGDPAICSSGTGMLSKALSDWSEMHRRLIIGEVTREEYQDWKDTYCPMQ